MTWVLALPILIPLLGAASSMLVLQRRLAQKWIGQGFCLAHLIASVLLFQRVWGGGLQVVQIGEWAAPFGISLVADHFGALMTMLASGICACVGLYSLSDIDRARRAHGFYPFLLVLLTGISGAFLTGDIFNLYVWFEVMLIAAVALISLGGEQRQLDGGFKYLTLNLVATALLLVAIGLLYGLTGSLNLADLSRSLMQVEESRFLLRAIFLVFLLALSIKSAVFPFFHWLPVAYPVASSSAAAVCAALLTKVGLFTLIRLISLLFAPDWLVLQPLVLILGIAGMLIGSLAAIQSQRFYRVLAFLLIAHIGYILVVMSYWSHASLTAAIFHMILHMGLVATLFLIGGVVLRLCKTDALKDLGGLAKTHGWLGLFYIIAALGIASVPPLVSFWSKIAGLQVFVVQGGWVPMAATLLMGFLTIYAMLRLGLVVFWQPLPEGQRRVEEVLSWPSRLSLYAPMVILLVALGFFSLKPQILLEASGRIAADLLNPQLYQSTVLGGLHANPAL